MAPQCNLIVDSCCDLPFETVNQPGIDLIRFPFMLDGATHQDDFYQTVSPKEFYDAMRDKKRKPPTTAQIQATVLRDTFARALASGVPTVYLSFTSGLSGSFDTACLIADSLADQYPQGKLYLVDTKLASIAEGLLVLGAIEQRERGLSAEEMVAWAKEAPNFVGAIFMVDDLESLRRGGRIPSTVAMAGAKLDVKPLLGFDLSGKLALTGVVRGRKKAMRQMVDFYNKHRLPDELDRRVIIGNADCEKDARKLHEMVEGAEPQAMILESSIGPVIGSHVGPGMLAMVFWSDDRRSELTVSDKIAKRIKERN